MIGSLRAAAGRAGSRMSVRLIGSGVKPANGSLRRSDSAGAGRRTSSAKEGRLGLGGGSGITGSG